MSTSSSQSPTTHHIMIIPYSTQQTPLVFQSFSLSLLPLTCSQRVAFAITWGPTPATRFTTARRQIMPLSPRFQIPSRPSYDDHHYSASHFTWSPNGHFFYHRLLPFSKTKTSSLCLVEFASYTAGARCTGDSGVEPAVPCQSLSSASPQKASGLPPSYRRPFGTRGPGHRARTCTVHMTLSEHSI